MQRTDSEMLVWMLGLLQLDGTSDAEAEQRGAALAGAILLKLEGRAAITAAMTAWMPKPGELGSPPAMTAINLIELECERVRKVEGFSIDGDDAHNPGTLASAGSAYAIAAADILHPQSQGDGRYHETPPIAWPFDAAWWKFDPRDPKRALVKAGQFIVAELDRELRKPTPMPSAEDAVAWDDDGMCNAENPSKRCICREEIGHRVCGNGEVPSRCSPDAIVKGARVRVFQSAPEWEGWVPEMSRLIGNQYIVEERVEAIRTHPATVKVGDWHIPAACCELVP